MRIVVTGASGFVGHALARRLPALGHAMVAVSRSAPPPGAAAAVTWHGVADREALRTALRGADALVHLAARVHVMHERTSDPLAAFRLVNVEGARVAAEAALEMGIHRSILMSTIKVLGENRSRPYDDDDVPAPIGAYAVSKHEAETVFCDRLRSGGWTILRPALVYGPGVGGNFERLLRLGVDLAGLPLPLGKVAGRRSLMFADNLADAVVAALQSPRAAGHAYVLADGERPTTAELLEALARLVGRRAVLLPVPVSVLHATAALVGRTAEVERLTGSLEVDASGFTRDTGWAQAVLLEAGLARTVAWRNEARRGRP